MRAKTVPHEIDPALLRQQESPDINTLHSGITRLNFNQSPVQSSKSSLSEILFITSYPPRECGIATYSQDLIKAVNNKFRDSISIKVCALESGEESYSYPEEVKYILKTSLAESYAELASRINHNNRIKIVLVQHEFGFYVKQENAFLRFLYDLTKPVVVVFHTVLPNPGAGLKSNIRSIAFISSSIIVMTNYSAGILARDYDVPQQKLSVIPHGIHLVPHLSKDFLKNKYGLDGRKVLSTFGLLSSGKGIETTLEALPEIVRTCPEVKFLIIGKTHPEVKIAEGEKYREMLAQKVEQNSLQDHVTFVNNYLALPDLLEYLQLTDIYIFTATDPNQAVSGTFAYAMSCACPIISTPIPHAKELLKEDTGIIFDFRNSKQLAQSVTRLLDDEPLRINFSSNTLQNIISTAWENSAVAHAMLLRDIAVDKIKLNYSIPAISLDHVERMTTDIGMIQFSKVNQPDIESGYTLDDNARALVAMCMFFKISGRQESLDSIGKYLGFIDHCQQPGGNFLNYVDKDYHFTGQNTTNNLDDSNGRAVWALGYLISLAGMVPIEIVEKAEKILERSLTHMSAVYSTRAMAFAVKGLYYYSRTNKSPEIIALVKAFADRLVQMYRHESNEEWEWYEGYLTYANSILPEALLYAFLITNDQVYKDIALSSMNFLVSQTFNENGIEVISNKNWLVKGQVAGHFGEQPIDVAYTVMTLAKFYDEFRDPDDFYRLETAFNWFLGKNRLNQIIYNPCTGGCYDGLEETHVNLNQGAESTLSYLMARLTMEKYKK
jgi:glycosyltransferase involved in cell wall biosynthesis